MDVRIVVRDPQRMRLTLAARAEAARDLTLPLEQSGALTRDAAVLRFKLLGVPPWIPSKKLDGRTGFDTGRLQASIAVQPVEGGTVKVGTNVPYARWFQEGTGIYAGHTAWTIRPVRAKMLSWEIGGRRFFAREVTIPGSPPRPFLFFDDDLIAAIMLRFRRALAGSAA